MPARPAYAHPLLQDAMQIDVARDRLTIRVTASWEEVLLAATAAGRGATPIDERIRRHGDYLLAHLTVDVDGRPARGEVTAVPPPRVTSPLAYVLSYRWPGRAGALPGRVTLRQRALREIGLALGGPWEVTYVATVAQVGRRAAGEPRLFGAAEPLIVDLDADARPAAGARGTPRLAWAYLRQGVIHILHGYDHLLFVAALVLAAATLMDLIKVVIAFTLAHATTLALCALRIISAREAIVEPLIAASIVVVALQNLVMFSAEPSKGSEPPAVGPGGGAAHALRVLASARRAPRLAVAFAFGLLHGCGFASGALQAMRDLPAAGVGVAVAAFSLGVEIGHQIVVIPAFMFLARLRERLTAAAMTGVQRAGSAAIAIAGGGYLWLALHR